ncbi:hypothetical protein H7171_03285 [Candidatus Saccharibacteria bacterium]|nr:hypothetical protein [Candidatus Saccharibacteria bacterium]
MLKIDNNLLQELGLGQLPDAEKNSLLKHVYETLEMRVGMRLADQMSNEQLDEFERYFEAKDDAGAFKWLESNFPNYKEIVQEEFDKLKIEVGQSAPQILGAAQAQMAAGSQPLAEDPQPQPSPQTQPTIQQPLQSPPAPQAPAQYAQAQPIQQPAQVQPTQQPTAPQQQYAQPQPMQMPQQQQPQQYIPQPDQPQYPQQQPPAGPAA